MVGFFHGDSACPWSTGETQACERPTTMLFRRLLALYRRHFHEPRRERLFLASLSFFLTFAITRVLTNALRVRPDPYPGLWLGGIHVHHLVWGILLLLAVGYGWLAQTGADRPSVGSARILSVVYGIGAALTLDEFALWLHLEDVYWEREGRASIDAVLLFGALVSVGLWGGPFLRAASRQLARPFRGR